MAATQSSVIDWHEAMQQCGDDEEFLREVLADLRTEVEAQLTIINEVIQNPQGSPFHQIMRSAHLLKGASANLMCGPLRTASMQLEESARVAHEHGETAAPPDVQAAVQAAHRNLQQAASNFVAFLFSIGV